MNKTATAIETLEKQIKNLKPEEYEITDLERLSNALVAKVKEKKVS